MVRNTLAHASTLIESAELCFWMILEDSFSPTYSRKDKLVKGWATTYFDKLQSANEYYYEDARKLIASYANNLKESASTAPEVLKHYLELMVDTNIDITSVFKYLDSLSDKGQWYFFYAYLMTYEEHQNSSGIKEFAKAAANLLIMYMYSATPTAGGTRLASINSNTGRLDYKGIDFAAIPNDALLEDYWNRLINHTPAVHLLDGARIIKGDDIPVAPQEINDALSNVRVESSADELRHLAETMLQEAKSSKKWTIPLGATVQFKFGPYQFAQIFELPTDIMILFRTSEWHFSLATISYKLTEGDHCVEVLDKDGKKDELKSAALFMLLSAVIRDFYVVEERHRVFKTERNFKIKNSNFKKEISIVYLPRIKYSYDYQLERLSSNLGFKERRAHFVSAHARRSNQASDRQKILAEMYKFSLPEGYTFVKPHERGHLKRETIYRSRSALQSLYDAEVYDGSNMIPDWFKFERDVASLMEKMGYTVDHVARSKNGDEGIDLFAYRQNGEQEENWIVQCKCYGKNKIGPAVIRELAGTVSLQKQKVSGMLVTTGEITDGARQLAKEAGIQTIDGKQFLEQLQG